MFCFLPLTIGGSATNNELFDSGRLAPPHKPHSTVFLLRVKTKSSSIANKESSMTPGQVIAPSTPFFFQWSHCGWAGESRCPSPTVQTRHQRIDNLSDVRSREYRGRGTVVFIFIYLLFNLILIFYTPSIPFLHNKRTINPQRQKSHNQKKTHLQ
jgi:hypothetical protein